MSCDSERQPQIHPRRVAFDGRINKFFDFGEGNDLIEFTLDLAAFHTEDRAVEVEILTSRQFGVETRAHFKE